MKWTKAIICYKPMVLVNLSDGSVAQLAPMIVVSSLVDLCPKGICSLSMSYDIVKKHIYKFIHVQSPGTPTKPCSRAGSFDQQISGFGH